MDRKQGATYTETVPVQVMLDAATQFGLTREEAWRTFNAALPSAPTVTDVPEFLDEVAGAFAREILAKQRRILRDKLS
jgi:hypothetical protein